MLGRADDGDQGDRSETAPGAGKRAWWKDRDILVACGSYGMLALVFIILGKTTWRTSLAWEELFWSFWTTQTSKFSKVE